MPLNLQKNLPAVELLKKEHIFVMDSLRASEQDIRPLRVVVLNLMPLKITTETDLVRLLSNTPLQVELDFMKIKGHTPKNTPIEHMKEFYKDFDEMQDDFHRCSGRADAFRGSELLGGSDRDIRLGAYACDFYLIYMLGGASRVVPFLWCPQI